MNAEQDARSMLAEQIGPKAADELLKRIFTMTEKGASMIEIMQTVRDTLKAHAKPGAPQEVAVGVAVGEGAATGAATAAGTYAGNKMGS